jgi:hypothetical protein
MLETAQTLQHVILRCNTQQTLGISSYLGFMHLSHEEGMLENAQECPRMPKNAQECPRMPKNAQECENARDGLRKLVYAFFTPFHQNFT